MLIDCDVTGGFCDMARVFDRRGRVTWDEDHRKNEDRRLRERRQSTDRRGTGEPSNWDGVECRKDSRRAVEQPAGD